MTSEEKLEVARALSRLGVDVIEAGFPSASPDDFDAVKEIARTIGNDVPQGRISGEPPTICGLARATEKDIRTAADAVAVAKHPRIHVFLATLAHPSGAQAQDDEGASRRARPANGHAGPLAV